MQHLNNKKENVYSTQQQTKRKNLSIITNEEVCKPFEIDKNDTANFKNLQNKTS